MWSGPKLLEREREREKILQITHYHHMKGFTGDEQHSKADKKPVQLGKSGCCLHLCILDPRTEHIAKVQPIGKYVSEKNRAL